MNIVQLFESSNTQTPEAVNDPPPEIDVAQFKFGKPIVYIWKQIRTVPVQMPSGAIYLVHLPLHNEAFAKIDGHERSMASDIGALASTKEMSDPFRVILARYLLNNTKNEQERS